MEKDIHSVLGLSEPPRPSKVVFVALKVGNEPVDTMVEKLIDGKLKIGRGSTEKDLRGLYTPGKRLEGETPVLVHASNSLSVQIGGKLVRVDEVHALISESLPQFDAAEVIPADLLLMLKNLKLKIH
eukprot:118894-Prymnesium_polylepis.1